MRKIGAILKDIAQIENSKHINEQDKPRLIAELKGELDQATGQKSLEGVTPPSGGSTKAAK